MDARLFGGELPGFDKVGHERVVARELLDLSLVEQICSRVAYLRDDEALAFEHRGGAGGAHALATAPFMRRLQDRVVRGLDGAPELVRIGMLRRPLGDDVDGDFGCNLACGVAAHAVCHHKKVWKIPPRFFTDISIILIRRSPPSNICQTICVHIFSSLSYLRSPSPPDSGVSSVFSSCSM